MTDELAAIVTRKDSRDLSPLLLAVLRSDKVSDMVRSQGLMHPYSPVSQAWMQTIKAMRALMDGLDIDADGKLGTNHDPAPVLSPLRDVLYRVAEFVDIAGKQSQAIAKAAGVTERIKVSKTIETLLKQPCNALKHDGDRLGLLIGRQGNVSVWGFQLQRSVGGIMDSNPNLHEKRKAYAFNVELRRWLTLIYLASDQLARPLMPHLGIENQSDDPVSEALVNRIIVLPKTSFMWESDRHMPSIRLRDDALEFRLRGGAIEPLSMRDTDFVATFSNDGVTETYQLPIPD